MFVFEILNIIKFIAYMVGLACLLWYLYNAAPNLFKSATNVIKTYIVIILASALLTYTQFFTLTEKENVETQQRVMMKQSSTIRNDDDLNSYLEKNKVEKVDLAKEIEAKLAKEKAKTEKTIQQSFSEGEK